MNGRRLRLLFAVTVITTAILSGTLAGPSSEPFAEAATARPNVVIILTDDERAGLSDAMPVVRRRVQKAGLTFTNYMVPTTLCCPSRASLLTGKFSHGTGVWNNGLPNDVPLTGGQAGFVANGNESQTLAAVLDEQGY
jgi:N-acetylglucosamine-6-sulfatase